MWNDHDEKAGVLNTASGGVVSDAIFRNDEQFSIKFQSKQTEMIFQF